MVDYIKHMTNEKLGESKGMSSPSKDISWWNEEVKTTINNKRICYRNLGKNRDKKCFEKYKLAKEATRVYNDIYDILE